MRREDITIFGKESISHVEKTGLFSYAVVRNCDRKHILFSRKLKKFLNDDIFMTYTGMEYGTGDFVLLAETVNGSVEIYRWKGKVNEINI
jgi:hypothetical protein